MTWRKVLIDIHSCIKGGGRNWLTYLNICLLQTLEKRVKLATLFSLYGSESIMDILIIPMSTYLAMMEQQIIDY